MCCVSVSNTASYANNFIVGLTNIRPSSGSAMSLRSYWLCGQYPGAVIASQTVTLYCASNLPPSRYAVVQYPSTSGIAAYFCEVEVFALGQQSSDIHHYLTNNTVVTCLLYTSDAADE